VFGRVVDPDHGRGVAGAKVDVVGVGSRSPDFYVLDNMVLGNGKPGVRTDADGRFALPAEDGDHWLVASEAIRFVEDRGHGLGRAPTPRLITLAPGAELRDLELALQPTRTVPGKLRAPLPRGAHVRFLVQRESLWSSESMEYRKRFPLDRRGGFVAAGLLSRGYEVQVLLPRLFRQGMPDKVPIGTVSVDGKPIELDALAAVPVHVRGRVVTRVPPQRAAVVLMPTAFANQLFGVGHAAYDGPVCPLGRDGEFLLRGASGARTLVFVDLLTGVVLAHQRLDPLAPGASVEVAFEPAVQPGPMAVEFRGLPASDTLWLDVRVADEQWLQVGQVRERAADGAGGVGTTVPRGTREMTLWLPPGETTLQLRTQEDLRGDDADVLARVVCDPASLREGRIAMQVK
jgi:hypothetical protein